MVPDALTGGPRFAAFCEHYVRHTKGRWARSPVLLEGWQRDFWWEALEVDPVTGLRVYSEVGLGLPRKNGKSVQASAAGLYFLVADGEAEPEVYVAAAARNQAGIVLGQSRRMAQQSPRLARHVSVRTTLIECPRNGGVMRSLSADAALQHGLNPYANIIDELHAHRTADLYTALTTGTGAREQPFTLWISTAGVDVLVVGYVSRFLRNLKQTLIAVEDHLHAAGVVVLFADERLLSSDPGSWDQFIREAHEAEAYSRKLSKRVGEGYAAKRRRLGVPGGNKAPYGIVREGKPSVLRVDEAQAAIVRWAYQLAATGSTDWEVAVATGLAKTHVGELLTNPIYAGRLRTGEPAGVTPIVDQALWSTVQTMRERRRTRAPGRIVKRDYALRLRCACCGRYLYGDVGRYRHPAPTCPGFLAATPVVRRRRRGCREQTDHRVQGHSYPQAWYEDAVGDLLGAIGGLDDKTITEVVALYGEGDERPDELTLARIAREREDASQRLVRTRDIAAWQATMARLDAEEGVAR